MNNNSKNHFKHSELQLGQTGWHLKHTLSAKSSCHEFQKDVALNNNFSSGIKCNLLLDFVGIFFSSKYINKISQKKLHPKILNTTSRNSLNMEKYNFRSDNPWFCLVLHLHCLLKITGWLMATFCHQQCCLENQKFWETIMVSSLQPSSTQIATESNCYNFKMYSWCRN